MAKYLTTNAAYVANVDHGKEVCATGLGTWDGATCTVSVKDGFGMWTQEPNNGSHTANFSYVFTIPEESGLQFQLSSVGANTNVSVSVSEIRR